MKRFSSGILLALLLVGMLASIPYLRFAGVVKVMGTESNPQGGFWAGTDWNKTYGGTKDDQAYSVTQSSDGGYAISGYTYSYGNGKSDMWLVKTDSSGTMQWSRTYGGTNFEAAICVVQTSDGGYALAGYTDSYGVGNYDFWLVKTNSAGNTTWSQTYGGINLEQAYSLIPTSDGGYALAGLTDSFGAGNYDFWLVKTNSAGNISWSRAYGGTNDDRAWSVIQTADGGYALAGYTKSYGVGNYDFWLVKTNSAGNISWSRTYGGLGEDRAYRVVQTSDGGYAVGGSTNSSGAGVSDFWLVKTDSAGIMQWNRTYGGLAYDWAFSMVQTSDEGYALAGGTQSFGAGNFDFWFVKTDPAGIMEWNRTYGGTNWDWSRSMVQTSDGGYALTGYTNSFGAGINDFWLIKLTPQTIYIRADGSVDPPTAPIQRNGDLYTITDNIYNTNGILIERNNMTLDGAGYTVQGLGGGFGVLLGGDNVSIRNINIKSFYYGVSGNLTQNAVLSQNNITNNGYGVWFGVSSNIRVSGNRIAANTYDGIKLLYSTNNTVIENKITANNWDGIYLYSSANNSIVGNNITANAFTGILLYQSSNYNSISANNVTNNQNGIALSGEILSMSSNNIISGNNITANIDRGIWLGGSPNNSITGNNIANNLYGILFDYSTNYNTVTGNTIAQNYYGLYFWNALNNSIFHNNVVNNSPYQVYNYNLSSSNIWDDDYPSGGNYWSDYNGTDLYRGPSQDQPGSDAIGDTPYVIDVNNQDHYPLMGSFGTSTKTGDNVTVFPTKDVAMMFKKVTKEGYTRVKEFGGSPPPPLGRILVGPYYDIKTTASYTGKITVRIIYDDTGLTPEQEGSLLLAHWLLLGDITGETSDPYEFVSDGKVDIKDIAIIAKYFGQNTPPAPPECDISSSTLGMPDGKIDIKDIALAAKNFGKTAQPTDITTYLDTENNVIYGETDHLSIFGVHRFG